MCHLHPRDDVSVVVTGQSLLLLQRWVALGHRCHLPGTRRCQGCGGSRGLPGMQGKAGPWFSGGCQGELPGSDTLRNHGIVEYLGWKSPPRPLSPTVPPALPRPCPQVPHPQVARAGAVTLLLNPVPSPQVPCSCSQSDPWDFPSDGSGLSPSSDIPVPFILLAAFHVPGLHSRGVS